MTVKFFVAGTENVEAVLLLGSPQPTVIVCTSDCPISVKLPVSVARLFSVIGVTAVSDTVGAELLMVTVVDVLALPVSSSATVTAMVLWSVAVLLPGETPSSEYLC